MEYKSIAVVGAGSIGTSVACDLVLNGFNTILVDILPGQLERSKTEILITARFAPMFNKELLILTKEEILAQTQFTCDLSDVKDCDFIIESIPDELVLKERVYKKLDQICKPHICIGMNTSCTSVTQIGSITSRPENIIGVHFKNPVYLKKTIEIIRGKHTSDNTLNMLTTLLKGLNKERILVNGFPGLVSNRASHSFMNEAAFVVKDQVPSPGKVDVEFKKHFRHVAKPLETADLIE